MSLESLDLSGFSRARGCGCSDGNVRHTEIPRQILEGLPLNLQDLWFAGLTSLFFSEISQQLCRGWNLIPLDFSSSTMSRFKCDISQLICIGTKLCSDIHGSQMHWYEVSTKIILPNVKWIATQLGSNVMHFVKSLLNRPCSAMKLDKMDLDKP